jgi:uncharacterized membrane protein YtjA (UPF0391 family)
MQRGNLVVSGEGELADRMVRWHSSWSPAMLYYSLIFLVIALLAGLFGFGIIAGTSYMIAKVLFFVFLIMFIVSLIFGLGGRKRMP